ncbi:MAG: AAA family ATPase [Sphingobacteriales bacterium]|nr:AAA family ATPase [Sphingobacteriales bacterium]
MENVALQHHEMNLFENGGSYINCKRIYFSYYKKIPNVKVIKNINETLFYKWLDTYYGSEILKTHSSQIYSVRKKGMRSVNTIYFLSHELMIDMEDGHVVVAHQEEQEAAALQIIQQLKKIIRHQKTKHEFCLISSSSHGLHTYEIDLKKPKLDLKKHYNDDIETMHTTTLKCLRQKNKSGLILLHGIPGTGKSTYIRYLIHQLKKKVIFMPPNFAKSLEAPEVTRLLIENANSIFVIEDAEDLLVSRDQFKNSSISMLLNLTDGLLGESLGIQIIATFNTHISNIDKALLRKGRLIGLYEFKPLSMQKSKVLLEEQGVADTEIKQPMTLADIYNTEQNEFTLNTNKRTSIGFSSGVN